MPFHRLPFELYSTILKAVNLWVEDYGPSEAECTCTDTCTNGECLYVPAELYPCRVSEVLAQLDLPDLSCAICGRVCLNRLSRTACGMVEWRNECEVCDLGCEE